LAYNYVKLMKQLAYNYVKFMK